MMPRTLLFYISLWIIIFNILTVRFRNRKAVRFENRLRELSEIKGEEMTIQGISAELEIPLYDAKILARKFVSKGKMEIQPGETETYVFKS
jgi:hypothetical protein